MPPVPRPPQPTTATLISRAPAAKAPPAAITPAAAAGLLVFCLLSLLLTAGYYLFAMQRTLFGRLTKKIDLTHVHDVDKIEAICLGVLALLVVLYGVWPELALTMINLYSFPGVI